MIKAADLLTPLVKLMEDDIQNYDIAYADETTLQVLKEKDKLPTQKSYMWLFIGGPPQNSLCLPILSQSLASIPADFFADFKGYLHADCYQAYITLGTQEHIQHVACFAHARRYFVDVAKTTKKQGLAHQVITLIGKLYHLEAQLKEQKASTETIFAAAFKTHNLFSQRLKKS